jgi:hypothetical protein
VKNASAASRNAMDNTTIQNGIKLRRAKHKQSLPGNIADGDEKIKRNKILGAGSNIIEKPGLALRKKLDRST